MAIWFLIGSVALIAAAVIGRAMLRGGSADPASASYDLEIYTDQLKEVDRDLARGVLSPEEAERARTEVSRRILAADAQMQGAAPGETRNAGLGVTLVCVAALIGGAVWLYQGLGAPGYADLPIKGRIAASDQLRQERLTQQAAAQVMTDVPRTPAPEASAEYQALMVQLREAVEARPDDLQGLRLLARNEASLGNAAAAADAQAQILLLLGDAATAEDHSFYADVLITAVAGYVSQEAEAALQAALALDPKQPVAHYYMAQYMLQVDRPDRAFRVMEQLLRTSRPDAPWLPSLRAQIEEVAYRAGVNYELPPVQRESGPSASDIAAFEDMPPEDRRAMIEGMVAQLSERLASEGGSAAEWARLIRALGVLERYDQARSIFIEALRVFESREAELEQIRAAGRTVGISEDDL